MVKAPAFTASTQSILRRGLVDQFVSTYLDGKGLRIRAEYAKDWNRFKNSFTITEDLFDEFRSFLTKHEIKIDEKDLEKDRPFIKTRLKATFARNFWGNEGWYPMMLQVDTQFQKALTLFPEAEKIAKLN